MGTRRHRPNLTKAQIDKAVQMYRDGEKLEYIAAIVGCSMTCIHRHVKQAGLSRGKGRRVMRLSA